MMIFFWFWVVRQSSLAKMVDSILEISSVRQVKMVELIVLRKGFAEEQSYMKQTQQTHLQQIGRKRQVRPTRPPSTHCLISISTFHTPSNRFPAFLSSPVFLPTLLITVSTLNHNQQLVKKPQQMLNLLLPLLTCLLITANSLQYQSYGDFTRPQLAQVIQLVQKTLQDSPANKAKTISDQLNTIMDPSWYVIYMDKTNNFQNVMVVYGYAFKNHWMWLSNFVGGRSVVLWKDYNCDEFVDKSITDLNTKVIPPPSEFTFDGNALEIQGLNSLKLYSELSPEYLGEPWKMAFDIVTALNNNQNAYAFTGFGVQIPAEDIVIPQFSYCVCHKKEKYDTLFLFQVSIKNYSDSVAAKGLLLLMRTR